jgi:hypothetical protein
MLSWACWGIAVALSFGGSAATAKAASYVALSANGCAAVAVLGARRPGLKAWNFVVLALLAVDLLPLGEGFFADGVLRLDVFRIIFLAAALTVGLLNYLPTRLAPAAVLLMLGCAVELKGLVSAGDSDSGAPQQLPLGWLPIIVAPWVGYLCMRSQTRAGAEFDLLWLDFRDRFGFVWAQRLRDQFNRSAAHAGWPVVLDCE